MKSSLRGFATVAAVALMVMLTASLSIAAQASAQVELGLKRAVPWKTDAWKTLGLALDSLEFWRQSEQTFAQWAPGHPQRGLAWTSLSGRINLNTASPFLLAAAGIQRTLKGVSVDEFVRKRSLAGPTADTEFYAGFFEKTVFSSWYTVHSLWNVNTADEGMLEAVIRQRTGSETLASASRAFFRGYREKTKRLKPEDFARLSSLTGAVVQPLLTLEPELNVNDAPEGLLLAMLSHPVWKVADPETKTRRLVQDRGTLPWTAETIRPLLAVDEDNLILSYLGARTRFLDGTVTTAGGVLSFTIYLAGDKGETARIVNSRWVAR